ncbi:MAG TPA: metallophosphoesterase [Acidimicrobiales bacterium]|nr:metallophosphoesterase [Acidimicrobiales bacterium]
MAAFLGALAAGRTTTSIGPFDAAVTLRASWTGDTLIRLGPLGSLLLDTHDGPFGISIDARDIDLDEADRLVRAPSQLASVDDRAARDAESAVRAVVLRAAAGAVAGAVCATAIRRPTRRRVVGAAVVALASVVVSGALARVSWDAEAIAAPRYTGLLTVAPKAVGALSEVTARFDEYSTQVASLVGNLSALYNTASNLPVIDGEGEGTFRLLHVSDLHLNPAAFTLIEQLVRQFDVDAVVDTGDINDWGTTVEGRFVEPIGGLGVPYVFVRGNHDSASTAAAVASQPNAVVLDGDVADVGGLRIFGIGDPRFTPDKRDAVPIEEERAQAVDFGPELAARVDRAAPVDVVAIHDPRAASRLGGLAPLVLAGHVHQPSSRRLGPTLLLVEGSTGGAGLRGLQGDTAVPLTATVLHFSRSDRRLLAFDRVSVAGLGGTGARIQRHVL